MGRSEEQGGVILINNKTREYEFVKISNMNTGKPNAFVLYTMDLAEFGDKVISQLLDRTKSVYASFHTHPGVSTYPSHRDLTELFTSFQLNYIYSPHGGSLSKYKIVDVPKDTSDEDYLTVYDGNGAKLKNVMWFRTDETNS